MTDIFGEPITQEQHMSNQMYVIVQRELSDIVGNILAFDNLLVRFLESINMAETMGPILDPTLYMLGQGPLRKVRRSAEIILNAKKELEKVGFKS